MSTDELRRAADRLRSLRYDIPEGDWSYGLVDPRPNFELFCSGRTAGPGHRYPVVELNWGRESHALPEMLALLLNAAEPLIEMLDRHADVIEEFATAFVEGTERKDDQTESDEAAIAVARAILREAS